MALPWIEIVECLDPDPQLVLWRYPDPDGRIKSGAKLIVRENQNVLLLAKGQAAGVSEFDHFPSVRMLLATLL